MAPPSAASAVAMPLSRRTGIAPLPRPRVRGRAGGEDSATCSAQGCKRGEAIRTVVYYLFSHPPTSSTVIGVYQLPAPATPTPSLPLITVTLKSGGKASLNQTLSTSTPKSKHPTHLSYRYDTVLTFTDVDPSSTLTFNAVQSGATLGKV